MSENQSNLLLFLNSHNLIPRTKEPVAELKGGGGREDGGKSTYPTGRSAVAYFMRPFLFSPWAIVSYSRSQILVSLILVFIYIILQRS